MNVNYSERTSNRSGGDAYVTRMGNTICGMTLECDVVILFFMGCSQTV